MRFFQQAAAIHADPFDSDTDTDPDEKLTGPSSAKTLCFHKEHFVDINGTSVKKIPKNAKYWTWLNS
jgi:hypothetical protein